ncbi:putative proline utilization protein PrnX [Cladophialophora carrionii]|uniref:Putative proline utilization protein PrnX n=1 Tax=Cladophialophora carrionii TaxID=86049 RepID=A0A1C1CIA3_9EURO|nr:putative proline utilization protein PrnX [Cladophialophora carrionii]
MPLTVLTDADVQEILYSLTKEDVDELQSNLAEALHSYSTGDTNSPCSASFQPHRTVIKKNGITTLFMPASTGTSVGMKIVSLEQPVSTSKKSSVSSSTSEGHSDTPAGSMSGASIRSATNDLGSMTLSPASTMSSGRNSIDGSSFQPPVSVASSQSTAPKGSITLLDRTGNPLGIVNAEELTAFRTALASTMMLTKRQNVHTVTVFGAGNQAYWHLRLALILRGDQIHHVNIINRSFERSIKLMKAFQMTQEDRVQWRKDIKFSAMSPEFGEYGRLLKEEVRKADVIFCCTPSTDPLFPAEFLTSREGRRKGRYIAAIGSYAPHMVEIHPDVLRVAVEPDHGGHHHHKHARQGGVIIVDSLESCLKEAGEVIKAKLKPEHLVEVGELMMIKKAATKEIELGGPGEQGLLDWLTKGNVIYKSVGMGLMDLVVAGDLIRLAKSRDVGVTIEDF